MFYCFGSNESINDPIYNQCQQTCGNNCLLFTKSSEQEQSGVHVDPEFSPVQVGIPSAPSFEGEREGTVIGNGGRKKGRESRWRGEMLKGRRRLGGGR